jgi:hypothetical protein
MNSGSIQVFSLAFGLTCAAAGCNHDEAWWLPRVRVAAAPSGEHPKPPPATGPACAPLQTPSKLPHAVFNLAAVAAPGGEIYLVGGNTQFSTNQGPLPLTVYDPSNDSYTELPKAPFDLLGQPSAAFSAGRLVVSSDGEVGRYDPQTKTWSVSTASHPKVSNRGAATGPDGLVYFFGGEIWQGGEFDSAETYDPIADRWAALPPMPVSSIAPAVVALDGSFYVFGFTASHVFDSRTRTWSELAPMPTQRMWMNAVLDASDRVFTIGGSVFDVFGPSSAVEIYDSETQHWSSAAAPPVVVSQMGTARGCSGAIYLFGGGNGSLQDVVQVYTPDGQWLRSP